jgi:hypothetical protein
VCQACSYTHVIQNELNLSPVEPFNQLLSQYATLCRELDTALATRDALHIKCEQCCARVWQVEQRVETASGQCGDKRVASGSTKYDVHVLHLPVVNEMKELLRQHRIASLDEVACTCAHRDALATQCSWYVCDAVDAFCAENGLTLPINNQPLRPTLLAHAPPHVYAQSSRVHLRTVVSVLFHHLRQPTTTTDFVQNVRAWIVRAGAVLLTAATYVEHQLLLNHLLRCPVTIADWGVQLCQPMIDVDNITCDARTVIDHYVAMLCTLLSPIRKRDEFLARCIQQEGGDNVWTVVDDDGEEAPSAVTALTEQDLLALLAQFPMDPMYAHALNMWTSAVDEASLLSLFAFQLTLMKLLSDGASMVAAGDKQQQQQQYVQLGRQLAHVMRCVRTRRCPLLIDQNRLPVHRRCVADSTRAYHIWLSRSTTGRIRSSIAVRFLFHTTNRWVCSPILDEMCA